MNGQGNSSSLVNYEFIDNTFEGTAIYYRLKQIDFDGAFEYSKVVVFEPESGLISVKQNSNHSLTASNLKGKELTWQVYNLSGQEILSMNLLSNEDNTSSIALNDLEKGCYMVVVSCGRQSVAVKVVL